MKISEISINYKPLKQPCDPIKVTGSIDAVNFLRKVWSDKIQYIEECYVLVLNRSNKITGFLKLSEGGTSGTVVDPKIVFQSALKSNAQSIILSHNHPSGNNRPSDQDIAITKQLREAGRMLDIPVLDHVILTEDGYFSFADEGMI